MQLQFQVTEIMKPMQLISIIQFSTSNAEQNLTNIYKREG
jgi:hypothetical protein